MGFELLNNKLFIRYQKTLSTKKTLNYQNTKNILKKTIIREGNSLNKYSTYIYFHSFVIQVFGKLVVNPCDIQKNY